MKSSAIIPRVVPETMAIRLTIDLARRIGPPSQSAGEHARAHRPQVSQVPDQLRQVLVAVQARGAEVPDPDGRSATDHVPRIRARSTSTSQPGADGSKPCSTSQRTAVRLRKDHHARMTSMSTSASLP